MKLATLRQGGRDGNLIVVSKDLRHAVKVPDIAKSMITALESWQYCEYNLQQVYHDLNHKKIKNSFNLDIDKLASPLPRSFQRFTADAYIPQLERSFAVRGEKIPQDLLDYPVIHQSASDNFLACRDAIPLSDDSWKCDTQAQLAVITDDVPLATSCDEARYHIRLLVLVNDLKLHQIPGYDHESNHPTNNPCISFSPVAVTPDEFDQDWHASKLQLKLLSRINDHQLGLLSTAEDMQFDFSQLISSAAQTRNLSAGTIVCSGPVSNADSSHGTSSVMDQRNIEILEQGQPITSYLTFNDKIQIDAINSDNSSAFGRIEQSIVQW